MRIEISLGHWVLVNDGEHLLSLRWCAAESIVVDGSEVDVSQLAISDSDRVSSTKESLSMTSQSSLNKGRNLVESCEISLLCSFVDSLALEPTLDDWVSSLREDFLDVLQGGVDLPAGNCILAVHVISSSDQSKNSCGLEIGVSIFDPNWNGTRWELTSCLSLSKFSE